MPDLHKNFSYSTVAAAPSPADSGTSLDVQSGQGTIFPTPPFNATVWPVGVQPLTTNAEIVRVTNITTDTFTITRAQESSTARSIVTGDQIAATITAKTLTDSEAHPVDDLTDVDTTTTTPNNNEVLKWNGSNWVPAVYDYDFTFTLDSFAGTDVTGTKLIGAGQWKAIGAISFTATYSNDPVGTTAVVDLSGSATAWAGSLSMTPIEGPETNTEKVDYPSTRTGSLTFTLTPSNSPTPATRTDVQAFSNTMRYGTNANGIGAQTEANIEALSEVSGPNESRSQTINNIATGTGGHYLTFSYADALSDVSQVQADSGFGFVTASFNSTATTLAPSVQTGITNVANSASFSETFAAVTSRLSDITDGSRDFKLLTTSTAINYIYWGESTTASSITEATIEANYATQPGKVGSNSMSSRSMTVNATGSEYVYIAYPARLGALTSILIGGFESLTDFNVDNTALAMTNPEGYQENYRVYISINPGFSDPTTMTVTI